MSIMSLTNKIYNWWKNFSSANVDINKFVLENLIFLAYSDRDTLFRSIILWD